MFCGEKELWFRVNPKANLELNVIELVNIDNRVRCTETMQLLFSNEVFFSRVLLVP